MLVDLHCHTQPLSMCSELRIEQLVELTRSAGIDAICLTEHDRRWDEAELAEQRRILGFPLFSAVEYTVAEGHVLAFGVPHRAFAGLQDLVAAAETANGLLFLAHPARDGTLRISAETLASFAGIEVENGSDSRLKNLAAAGLSKSFRLPGIGGSDAHSAHEAGGAATRFRRHLSSDADLVDALRSGDYEAVRL